METFLRLGTSINSMYKEGRLDRDKAVMVKKQQREGSLVRCGFHLVFVVRRQNYEVALFCLNLPRSQSDRV